MLGSGKRYNYFLSEKNTKTVRQTLLFLRHSRDMAKGKSMTAFWASVANARRLVTTKDASTQTVADDFPRQSWEFPHVGEEDLEEIIRKLQAGQWRLNEHGIRQVDVNSSMENCPPTEVSEIASTVSV